MLVRAPIRRGERWVKSMGTRPGRTLGSAGTVRMSRTRPWPRR
ncbi:hypothetical protein ACTODO_00557 [Schaalia dentiphila ATCC 17982]|uniref:Uncharacterized protein n=1 Tax=Schaalia dentiphila ATCC 17982 TaxID=411466 RepID=A7BA96_9ACTO|nr:hypothetical protein ACTODO_00557 [Schaalia odontolytica ATCC 17982]